jgi:signal transduction histidine kinase
MANVPFSYKKALSAMGERIIVLDVNCNTIIWYSEEFVHSFPGISMESTIQYAIKHIGLQDIWSEYISKYKNKTIKLDYLSYRTKCKKYYAEIYRIDENYTLIRLQEHILLDEANSRHLEDRERLIYTAGSITVSEMASTLAHEINQPVGTINNLLHGIRERIIAYDICDQTLVRAIEKSIEQAQYTANIISRIRDYTYTRLPKVEEINLNKLIDKCISLMDWEVHHTNVKIKHKKLVCDPLVQGDEIMLQQVIVNLVRNGIESMTEREKVITITTMKDDDYIKVTVKDNGKGISNDELNAVFIPFSSKKHSGMGIGLNICRSFIEMHRGKIWLTQNNDRGCTSHILLPTHNEGSL